MNIPRLKVWGIPLAILVLASILRLWQLDIKPPHFDEGINGWFAHQMVEKGFYDYNPENFHGPLYFYLVHSSQTFFGSELVPLRLPAVVGSLLLVAGLLSYRDIFGPRVANFAALGAALAPAQVFYGRYSIHESWFAASLAFTLLGILGLWKYGSKTYLWVLFAGITAALTTKETYLIHFGCLILAWPCCWWYTKNVLHQPLGWAEQSWKAPDSRKGIVISGFVLAALYSGMFMHWSGIIDFFRGLVSWIGTGVGHASGHEKPWHYWLFLITRYEWITLIGLLACFRFLWPSDPRMRYVAIYSAGALLAYSIVAYKTPWCMVSIQWPFFLLAGYIFSELATRAGRAVTYIVAVPVLLSPLIVTLPLNWEKHSDPTEPYAYVTTSPRIWDGVNPLLAIIKDDPRNCTNLSGFVALDSYYPLPWILHQFSKVGYGNHPLPERLDFAIVESEKINEVPAEYRTYLRRTFQIRDGQKDSILLLHPRLAH